MALYPPQKKLPHHSHQQLNLLQLCLQLLLQDQLKHNSPHPRVSVTHLFFMLNATSLNDPTKFQSFSVSTVSYILPIMPPVCECIDLKNKKRWACGETWTENCFNKNCTNGKIVLTPVTCPKPVIPTCPRGRATKVSDGCCETWKCDCKCYFFFLCHCNCQYKLFPSFQLKASFASTFLF